MRESAEMISPSKTWARWKPAALLPTPVGPPIASRGGSIELGGHGHEHDLAAARAVEFDQVEALPGAERGRPADHRQGLRLAEHRADQVVFGVLRPGMEVPPGQAGELLQREQEVVGKPGVGYV